MTRNRGNGQPSSTDLSLPIFIYLYLSLHIYLSIYLYISKKKCLRVACSGLSLQIVCREFFCCLVSGWRGRKTLWWGIMFFQTSAPSRKASARWEKFSQPTLLSCCPGPMAQAWFIPVRQTYAVAWRVCDCGSLCHRLRQLWSVGLFFISSFLECEHGADWEG